VAEGKGGGRTGREAECTTQGIGGKKGRQRGKKERDREEEILLRIGTNRRVV